MIQKRKKVYILLFLAATLFILQIYSASAAKVVHLKFEGDIIDSSGNGNNGQLIGQPDSPSFRFRGARLEYVNGKVGKALNFKQTQGQEFGIQLRQSAKVGNLRKFTIMAWVNPTIDETQSQPGYMPIISEYNQNIVGRYMFGVDSKKYSFLTNVENREVQSKEDKFGNKWTHLAVVVDKDKTGEEIVLYLNGVQTSIGSYQLIVYGNEGDYKLLIGAKETTVLSITTMTFFKGLIDEIKMFDEALDRTAIIREAEGLGCSDDVDCDGVVDSSDNCAQDPNPGQADSDRGGVGDACDNCPNVRNTDQLDSNSNKVGDACESSTGGTGSTGSGDSGGGSGGSGEGTGDVGGGTGS